MIFEKKKIGIAFCVAVLVVMALFLGGCSSGQTADSGTLVPVSKRDFNIELNIVGVLDAAKSHMISSELEGTNGTIIYLINDGKSVVKGETLVRFDRALFEKEVAEFEAQVESYAAAVAAAEQVVAFEINQVEKELVNARYGQSVAALELKQLEEGDGPLKLSMLMEERQKVLIELKRFQDFLTDLDNFEKKGFKNPSEISSTKEKIAAYETELASITKRYETYKNNVLPVLIESGKAKVQNAEMLVQQTEEGGKHKIAKARATLLQVKAMLKTQKSSLEKARFKLSKTEIVAPFDGIVIHYQTFRNGEKRKPREGDSVFMNQPILYLPDITKMVIKTRAREVDLHKIKLGQRGSVVVDAYPDVKLSGELTFVGSLATAEESGESYEKYFQVLFKVNEEDTRLRPGMTCRISIQAESVKDAVAIPLQAVFSHDQELFCYVKTKDGGFEERNVVTGRQNEAFVEITEGLTVGDQVSLIRPSL